MTAQRQATGRPGLNEGERVARRSPVQRDLAREDEIERFASRYPGLRLQEAEELHALSRFGHAKRDTPWRGSAQVSLWDFLLRRSAA